MPFIKIRWNMFFVVAFSLLRQFYKYAMKKRRKQTWGKVILTNLRHGLSDRFIARRNPWECQPSLWWFRRKGLWTQASFPPLDFPVKTHKRIQTNQNAQVSWLGKQDRPNLEFRELSNAFHLPLQGTKLTGCGDCKGGLLLNRKMLVW